MSPSKHHHHQLLQHHRRSQVPYSPSSITSSLTPSLTASPSNNSPSPVPNPDDDEESQHKFASLPRRKGGSQLYFRPHHPVPSSSSPLSTPSPTAPTSVYHSLPRGGRYHNVVSKVPSKALETTPYPNTSSAYSTIVRTAPVNVTGISARGVDACNRESSV